jgi:O-antigen/teichoic acid export membrane protein
LAPIYLRIDVLMLSSLQGSAAVGIYEAATNIFYRFNVFARMFNRGLMPTLTREYASMGHQIRRYIRALTKYEVVIGIPLTVFALLLAERLIPFLYGGEFEESVLVFQLLASITVVRLVNQTLGTSLTATDRQGWRSAITVAAALIVIGLNLVLLPRYSFQGAAFTTIVSEIFMGTAFYLVLRQRLPQPLSFHQFLRPLLAGLVMAGAIWVTRDAWLPVPFLAGGLAYALSLLALGTFSGKETRVLLHASRMDRFLSPAMRRRWMRQQVESGGDHPEPQEDREQWPATSQGTVGSD